MNSPIDPAWKAGVVEDQMSLISLPLISILRMLFCGLRVFRLGPSSFQCPLEKHRANCFVVVANMQRPNFVSNIIRGVGKLFTKTEQDVALQEFEAKLNRPRL